MDKLIDTKSGFPIGTWYRVCQACRHHQIDKEPDAGKELSSAYIDRKCRHCRSEALDYGTTATPPMEEDWSE